MGSRLQGMVAHLRGHDGRWMPAGAATPELLVTVALAAMLRLYRLADESLWLDEAYSVGIVRRHSYRWLLFEHPTFDPHPPLHYVLLKPWIAFFGASEMAVRLQAVLFGVGTVVVTYWLGRDLFGRQAGAIGALLVAVAPVHLWQSQTVRMYTLLAFMTGLSYLALVRLTREVTRRRAAVYILATALLGYTHVFGLFVILAQSVYLLTRPLLPGQELAMDLRRWVPLQGLVAVLLSPWLVELATRVTAVAPSSHISWIPDPAPAVVGKAYLMFVSGRYIDWHLDPAIPAPLPVLLGVVAGAAILLSVSRADARRTTADDATDRNDHHGSGSSLPRDGLAPVWLLTLLAVVPVAAPFVISKAITPILVLRYTLPASLGVYLLIGRGMGAVRPSAVRYLLVALLVAGMVVPLPTYYGADQKAQWREAASFVEGVTDEDDLVVLAPGHVWWPFHYYFDGPAEIETADASTSTGELREMARGHDRVVLVFRYPGDATRDRLRSALREGPNPRSPTERSYVVVSVVTYENSTAT